MAVRKNLYLLRSHRYLYYLGTSPKVTKLSPDWFDDEDRFVFDGGCIVDFCATGFHRCTHGIRLKPGQVKKVKITIEEVK